MSVRPLSGYCLQRTDLKGLIIGYGYAPLEAIHTYGPVLAKLINQHAGTSQEVLA